MLAYQALARKWCDFLYHVPPLRPQRVMLPQHHLSESFFPPHTSAQILHKMALGGVNTSRAKTIPPDRLIGRKTLGRIEMCFLLRISTWRALGIPFTTRRTSLLSNIAWRYCWLLSSSCSNVQFQAKPKVLFLFCFLVGIFKGELMDGSLGTTRLLALLLLYFIYTRSVHGLDTQCVRELCGRLQYSARRYTGKAVCWKLTWFQSLDVRFRWQIDWLFVRF